VQSGARRDGIVGIPGNLAIQNLQLAESQGSCRERIPPSPPTFANRSLRSRLRLASRRANSTKRDRHRTANTSTCCGAARGRLARTARQSANSGRSGTRRFSMPCRVCRVVMPIARRRSMLYGDCSAVGSKSGTISPRFRQSTLAQRHLQHRSLTRRVISLLDGGFSPRPRECSISWMTIARRSSGARCAARMKSRPQR
jgi:hypothetical protein